MSRCSWPEGYVATCHDPEINAQVVFVYDDTTKVSAKKIDFLPDSSSTVESLKVLELNEFRSVNQTVDYIIQEKMVNIVHVRNSYVAFLPQSRNLKRSDRD